MTDLDRFQGCIVGLAVGDAMGYPTEFRSQEQILAAYPPDGVTDFVAGPSHPPGTYTDDTQMTVALARGLLEAGGDDLDRLMHAIGREFVAWSQSPDNDRAPGNTCMAGCREYARHGDWRTSGVAGSKGCGSAMRAAPIGLWFRDDHDRLLEIARASSIITHGHPTALAAAAAAALLVALAVDDVPPDQMYDRMMEACVDETGDFDRCLSKLPDLLDAEPAVALSKAGLGEAWVGEEAVASALYCFWRSPDDFEKTVLTAANTDGDSDSIACIAGSISGAYNGLEAIPQRWRDEVEDAAMLHELGKSLYEAVAR